MENIIFSTCELVFTSVLHSKCFCATKCFCCGNVVKRWRSRPVL